MSLRVVIEVLRHREQGETVFYSWVRVTGYWHLGAPAWAAGASLAVCDTAG